MPTHPSVTQVSKLPEDYLAKEAKNNQKQEAQNSENKSYRVLNSSYDDKVFNVSPEHGFNCQYEPLKSLPDMYRDIQNLLDNLPVWTDFHKKEQGILSVPSKIQQEVSKLDDFNNLVSKEEDPQVLQALFRGYTFLSSAYLLEPAHQAFLKTGEYGKGLNVLPRNLAKPLCTVAKKLDVFPWLDYHYAYSLGNYVKRDPTKGMNWENLEMAVKFSGTPDEIGFIMLHVDINQYSPQLIDSIHQTFRGLENSDTKKILSGLKANYQTMEKMNTRRRLMWKASNHKNYNDFRVFIMGIKGNDDLFGDGVVYQGTDDESPRQYRGQSGSQDNIIPTEDIFTGVIKYYPNNVLTKYLLDMRHYRPKVMQAFYQDLQQDSDNLVSKLKDLDPSSLTKALMSILLSVHEIYMFRNGHWQFVQKYIMGNTKYAKATGGTPITTWIPNQIEACLKYMSDLFEMIEALSVKVTDDDELLHKFEDVKKNYPSRVQVFAMQIDELKKVDYDANLVYLHNGSFKDAEIDSQ